MKIRNSSRVLALVLALLMIVPLISVPAFAEDSANIIAKHTFDDITAVSDSISSSNPSLSLVEFEGRGNVLKFDLTDGASGSDTTFYLAKNQNSGKVAVTKCTSNGDNTYNGYFMDGSTKVYFKNATGTTKNYTTRKATTFYTLGADGVTETEYVYGEQASGWYLMTEAAINAWRGGGNIAAAIKVKHDAITSNVTTYSADYYFDDNFTVTGENKLFGNNFQGFNVSNSGGNVYFKPHTDLGSVTDGADFTVADNTWVNLSFVIDWAEGTYKLYADGVYKFTAKAKGDSYAPSANTWELIQANRGQGSAYDGFVMIDNATIYEGEVLPAYSYTETFDGTIGSKIQDSYLSKDGVNVVDGTAAGKDASDKVLQLTIPEGFNTTSWPYAAPMDVNGMINTPQVDANSGLVVLQSDVYIPEGTRVKLQTQIYAYKLAGDDATKNYISLWNIYAKADGSITLTTDGNKSNVAATNLKANTWHTIKTVLDLSTGNANVYVDGQFYLTVNTGKTNVTVLADSFTFVKANKFDTSGYGDCFAGNVYFDNLSFSTADASAMLTPPASYTVNFDNGLGDSQTKYYVDSYSAVEIVSGGAYGKAQDDLVLKLETKTVDGTAATPENLNRGILHSSYTYDYATESKLLVMKEDILIPNGTAAQLQSQIHGGTANKGTTNISFASLWQIDAKDTTKDATLKNDTTGTNEWKGDTVIPRGEWFTICTVLDLVTGWVEIYVNGTLRMEYFWVRSGVQLTNIKGNGSNVYMVKINNNAGYNGGAVLFDNVGLYNAVPAVTDNRFFNVDYEDATAGEHAVSASGQLAAYCDPASATYTDVEGNMVVKLDMKYTNESDDQLTSGGPNTDKMFKVPNRALVYSAFNPGYSKTVYSADYFFSADSRGSIESQIASNTWYSLYNFNLSTALFKVGNNSIAFEKGVWNNVKMVVTTTLDATTFDIYLNGIYVGSQSNAAHCVTDNSWSVAKIMKLGGDGTGTDKAGYVYIDNVSAVNYDVAQVGEIDFTKVVSYTVDGKTVANTLSGVKATYGATVTAITADEYFAANQLINTLNVSSIRLADPTGLRFATEVNMTNYAKLAELGITVTEAGTLISPVDYESQFGGAKPTIEVYQPVGEQETILKVIAGAPCTAGIVDDDANTTHFVGSIVNILEGNIDRAFNGRGYVTVTLANGTVLNVYSAYTHAISVKEQAQKTIDANRYEVDSPEYNILVGYAGPQASAQ